MSLDQYISAGASVGSFLAAFATFLTVWQIAKQRRATYRPDIVVRRARVITNEEEVDEDDITHLLAWRRDEGKVDNQESFLVPEYSLLLMNIGLGAATNVTATWEFAMVSFTAATEMLAVFQSGSNSEAEPSA